MGISASQERYVNFYTDFAFKKLFGTEVNKELLISFLNSLFEGREVIKDLKYLNGEHLGHVAAERKAVFDVYCENELGEKFLIEMQKAEQIISRTEAYITVRSLVRSRLQEANGTLNSSAYIPSVFSTSFSTRIVMTICIMR